MYNTKILIIFIHIIFILLIVINKFCLGAFLFPQFYNVILYKPIELESKSLTCGTDSKIALCDNRIENSKTCNPFSTSILYCDQACPYGTVFRDFEKLDRLKLNKINPCITVDTTYFLKNGTTKYSYFFSKNLCIQNQNLTLMPFQLSVVAYDLLDRRSLSSKTENEGFTVAFWFQQIANRTGTLLQLINEKNRTVAHLRINSIEQKVHFNYGFDKQRVTLNFKGKIKIGRWNFMAVKIFKNQLNVFINEPLLLSDMPSVQTAYLNMNLARSIVSDPKSINIFVGINNKGGDIFYGWIQDMILLTFPLSNREVYFLYNGPKAKDVLFQPDCKCPNDYARNENIYSRYCLRNDDISFEQKRISYLNDFAHPIEFINDNDFETSWISSTLPLLSSDDTAQPIALYLNFFNGDYIINRIEIYFTSIPPTNIEIERFNEGEWSLFQKYSTNCLSKDKNCRKLPKKFDRLESASYTIIWTSNSLYTRTMSDSTDPINAFNKQMANQDFVNQLRVSKLKIKLYGFYSEIKSDIRKLYYSISEIRVLANCDCNGFASTCDVTVNPYRCNCENTSFTEGFRCERCNSFYNNASYQNRYKNADYVCKICNCNKKADSCVFDKVNKTGVCLDCKNNTEGFNCESCKKNYYFDSVAKQCLACNCNSNGIVINKLNDTLCDSFGRCTCKQNVQGAKCDTCKPGFYGLSTSDPFGCRKCTCNEFGTINGTLCDIETGACKCKNNNIIGARCDHCKQSYYNLTRSCLLSCDCDPYGSLNPYCDEVTGECLCKRNVIGKKCSTCAPGFFNLTFSGCLQPCECNPSGSIDLNCNTANGFCKCREGYKGRLCDTCVDGYFSIDSLTCQKCACNPLGTVDASICDRQTGQCTCRENVEGEDCNTCKAGYWGLNKISGSSFSGCKKCDCDPLGLAADVVDIVTGLVQCDPVTSQCPCREFREGLRCEKCILGYFLVNINDIDCLKCGCDPGGTIAGTSCDRFTGECVCKVSKGIGGTRCNECLPGYYDFISAAGSCKECNCNPAGSLNNDCDRTTGQCECKAFVAGEKCNKCVPSTSNLNPENPYGCSKKPTQQSPPIVKQFNITSIAVKWSMPDYPNGIITHYIIRRNGSLIYTASESEDTYVDSDISPYTWYSYTVESFNDQGSAVSKPAQILTLPGRPCCGFDFSVSNINSRQFNLRWTIPKELNGNNPTYLIVVYLKQLTVNFTLLLYHNVLLKTNRVSNTILKYTVDSVEPYTQYYVSIKACNIDTSDRNCLWGTANSSLNSTNMAAYWNKATFVTAQDTPEQQPQPVIIEIKSTSIKLSLLKPLKPNGILLLYEVWVNKVTMNRKANTTDLASKGDSIVKGNLACALEEYFDPYSVNASITFNKTKQCTLQNLKPYSYYSIVAAVSTIAGRGSVSSELKTMTTEDFPLCPPKIVQAFSNASNQAYLKWEPSKTTKNSSWIDCIQGSIKEFNLFVETADTSELNLTNIYKGDNNEFLVQNLLPSTTYKFKVSLCNIIGCIMMKDAVYITTNIAPPNKNQPRPVFNFVNSSFINITWEKNSNKRSILSYRLERFKVAFAYPPTYLETGIRFHGFNYYNFSPSAFYPEGYSFFGLRFTFRTNEKSMLFYFAGSSDAQDELSAIQLSDGWPLFLSDTQADIDSCFVSLNASNEEVSYDDNTWRTMKVIRLENSAYMQINSDKFQQNASDCTNGVIDGVTGVFIGGLPQRFLKLDAAKYAALNIPEIERGNFVGCVKNVSTIIKYVDTQDQIASYGFSEVDFDFSNQELSPGEPVNSNTWYGCPLDLDTENGPVYFLGMGYLNLKTVEDSQSLFEVFEVELRTEYGEGIIYFAYDRTNGDYLVVNYYNSNKINIMMGYRASIRDLSSDYSANYLTFTFNQTFNVPNLDNGYWNDVKINFNVKDYKLLLYVNGTEYLSETLISQEQAKNLTSGSTLTLEIFLYLSGGFYFGGLDYDVTKAKIESYLRSVRGFRVLVDFLLAFNTKLYFSGCVRNIRINNVPLTLRGNTKVDVAYVNVRFDGCPPIYKYIKPKVQSIQPGTYIQTIYDGVLNYTSDSSFTPATEYFYRVAAYNAEGTVNSPWILIRTPEAAPMFDVDHGLIKVKINNGYSFLIEEIKNFCFYCSPENVRKFVFTGIIKTFKFIVEEYDYAKNEWHQIQEDEYSCDLICLPILNEGNSTENIYGDIENVMARDIRGTTDSSITVKTLPLKKYSVAVSVCTSGGCVSSSTIQVLMPPDAPGGVSPPYPVETSPTSVYLRWSEPKFPNSNITGYILKLVNAFKYTPIYYGMRNEFKIVDLEPYTHYTFALEACNRIGCTSSRNVTYATSELPPEHVIQPEVLSISKDSILFRWTRPTNLDVQNGIIRNYILYVDEVLDPTANRTHPLSLVYNISVCTLCSFLIQNVRNLTSGTVYNVHLSVCTGGGCKNSSTLIVKTNETEPDVDDVTISTIVQTASALRVIWNKPKFPNGKIIAYKLYFNSELIYEGMNNSFWVINLKSFTFYEFYLIICNMAFCGSTKHFLIRTDEAPPEGFIYLEAQATAPREISLKWSAPYEKFAFRPNGNILFRIIVEGSFLVRKIITDSKNQTIRDYRIINRKYNLLNATKINTKFGIVEKILPFSDYLVQVNATNTKGYIVSNKVKVSTPKTAPDIILPPELVKAFPRALRLKWRPPILINSDDKAIYYQLEYKHVNTKNDPNINTKIIQVFENATILNEHTVENLTPYSSYEFRLIASNAFGKDVSEWSDEINTTQDIPREQASPKVLSFNSTNALIEWKPPNITNGRIELYRIFVMLSSTKYQKPEAIYELNSTFNKFLVTNLTPYTTYAFEIESCNAVGCASSLIGTNKIKNTMIIKTLPDVPSACYDPSLSSPNSFTVNVKWSKPGRENGIISSYIIERFDYSRFFAYVNKSTALRIDYMQQARKYRFLPNRFNFTNIDDIEPCGTYMYRLIALNQIGNCTTNWKNITTKPSKPVMVYVPKILIVNSTTVKFDWLKPVTFCRIMSYTLIFLDTQGKQFYRKIEDDIKETLILNGFQPFTNYSVRLISCVDSKNEECTDSLNSVFQTPGTTPSGIDRPRIRLVTSNIISIQWSEPQYRNGQAITYQLVRVEVKRISERNKTSNNHLNSTIERSNIIYVGTKNYFIDKSLYENATYKYMVICTNEYGNSMSEWSPEVNTRLYQTLENTNDLNRIFIFFDLKATSRSPSAVKLNWKKYENSELSSFLYSIVTEKNSRLDKESKISGAQLIISRPVGNNKKSHLIFQLNLPTNKSEALVTHLYPNTIYVFSLSLTFEFGNSLKEVNSSKFKLYSEKLKFKTSSVNEIYSPYEKVFATKAKVLKLFQLNKTFITISTRLTDVLITNYDYYQITLNEMPINTFNYTKLSRYLNRTNSFAYGPLITNRKHIFTMKACYEPDVRYVKFDKIFIRDCINLTSINYSISTKAPEKLSELKLELLSLNKIKISWFAPLNPNGYIKSYSLYKKMKTLNEDIEDDETICFEKRNKSSRHLLNMNLYNPFNNASFDISKLLVNCGNNYYKVKKDYQCCSNLKYVKVTADQMCCPFNYDTKYANETKYKIGFGDYCCQDSSYYKEGVQKCCNNQLFDRFKVTESEKAGIKSVDIQERDCDANNGISLSESMYVERLYSGLKYEFLDSEVAPYRIYKYKICAKNSFGVSCNDNWASIVSDGKLPDGFEQFDYEVLNETKIILKWKPPFETYGEIKAYRLFRDNYEVYRGKSILFIDGIVNDQKLKLKNPILPYNVYEYTLSACNIKGCTFNSKTLYVTTKEKLPNVEKIFNVSAVNSSSINITWTAPSEPNGILLRYVLFIRELALKLEIYMDTESKIRSEIIFANNLTSAQDKIFLFKSNLVDRPLIVYHILVKNLQPFRKYSIRFSYCNSMGCVISKLPNKDDEFVNIRTMADMPKGLSDPIIFLKTGKSTEICWQKPKEPNGLIMEYRIYRNNNLIKTIETTSLNELDVFINYIDTDLQPKKYYSYQIVAVNSGGYSVESRTIAILALEGTFNNTCLNVTDEIKAKHSGKSATLVVLDVLKLTFDIESPREIKAKFNKLDLEKFRECVVEWSMNKLTAIKSQKSLSSIQSKLILNAKNIGVQTIDFPLPLSDSKENNNNVTIEQRILGLREHTNYSIRFVLSTDTSIFTTAPIFVKTFEAKPCCNLESPNVIINSPRKMVIVRWKAPEFPNGKLVSYTLNRTRLIGSGCEIIEPEKVNNFIEEVSKVNFVDLDDAFSVQAKEDFMYDELNMEYVFEDNDKSFFNKYAYYSYQLIATNRNGKLESAWSKPELLWQLKPYTPSELSIRNVHSNGFTLRFKQPTNFNGIISHYLITLSQLLSENKLKNVLNITVKMESNCKNGTFYKVPFISTPISGLQPYKSYKITVRCVNTAGLISDESESVIGNTLESVPSNLLPLNYEIKTEKSDNQQSIYFKFPEPETPNGIVNRYVLYQVKYSKSHYGITKPKLVTVYSGPDREFVFKGLKAFTEYSFLYSVCTIVGCTRQVHYTTIQTLEIKPDLQMAPKTRKTIGKSCIDITWYEPAKINGLIKKFELYRKTVDKELNHPRGVLINLLVTREFNNTSRKEHFYRDCELTSYKIYSYKIRSYNNAGFTESDYSDKIEVDEISKENLNELNITQLNHTMIMLVWSNTNMFGDIILNYYHIYRNQTYLASTKVEDTFLNVKYYDSFKFLPKSVYIYTIYACKSKNHCKNQVFNREFLTKDQAPSSVSMPSLIKVTSNQAILNVKNAAILLSNTQIIIEYRFYLNNKLYYQGIDTQIIVLNLQPYTQYDGVLEACTFYSQVINGVKYSGCKFSSKFKILTLESVPEDLNYPSFQYQDGNDFKANVLIKWKLPNKLNGILKEFEIKRNNSKIFSTTNMNITSFLDSQLLYGVIYAYELKYTNNAGSAVINATYVVPENSPKMLADPVCHTKSAYEVNITWSNPAYTNGKIFKYIITYFTNKNDFSVTIANQNHDKNEKWFIVDNLLPWTQYRFQISACNSKSCISSKNNVTCETGEAKPSELSPPNCTQSPIDQLEISPVTLKWKNPEKANGAIISYTLYRLDLGRIYDSTDTAIKRLFQGNKTLYLDYDIKPFNGYKYAIEANNSVGSVKSNWTTFYTSPIKPKILLIPGRILNLTNQSVTISINTPEQLNGIVFGVKLTLNTKNSTKTYTIYSNSQFTKSLDEVLNKTSLTDLLKNTSYELESEICNQVGCIKSDKTIKFKTLNNEEIKRFRVARLSSTSVSLKWNFQLEENPFDNKTLPSSLSFKIFIQPQQSDSPKKSIYEGNGFNFNVTNLKPFTSYLFDLVAYKKSEYLIEIDRKNLTVKTKPDKPILKLAPIVTKMQSDDDKKGSLSIDWSNSFDLNGPLIKHDVLVNNESIYSGIDTKYTVDYNINCDQYTVELNGVKISFDSQVTFTIETYTTHGFVESEFYNFEYNCTTSVTPVASKNFKGFIHEYWFIVLIIILNVLLIATILSLVLCFYGKRRTKSIEPYVQNTVINSNNKKVEPLKQTDLKIQIIENEKEELNFTQINCENRSLVELLNFENMLNQSTKSFDPTEYTTITTIDDVVDTKI